ncbi:MAG: F0F1 ATP synthase subunit delta [Candidatus Acidiferrum sp.]
MKSASLQYANALADIALAQGAAEPTGRQLAEFGVAYGESAELRNFLGNPAVALHAKHKVIEALSERLGASKIVRNFLFVIADHGRAHVLPEIITAFQETVRKRQGLAEAEIASATTMSERQKEELLRTLERLSGKKVQAVYSVDPALLGGAVVRIGDTIYDGSVRTRLSEMRAHLSSE